MLQMGAAGVGVGAVGGGLLGLRDFLTRRSPIPINRRPGNIRPTVIEAGPPTPEEEEAALQRRPMLKMAEPPLPRATDLLDDPAALARIDPSKLKSVGGHISGLYDFAKGEWTSDLMSKPWFMPAAVGAAGLGIYGGYKGVQGALNWRHKADRRNELDAARKEYRDALVSQYGTTKVASDNGLAKELDELAQEKVAAGTLANYAGAATGGYLTLAGLLAAGAGVGTYAYTKSNAPENRLAKAIQQRERLRWASRPPEIYAIDRTKPPKEEEDLNGPVLGPQLKMSQQDMAALYRSAAQ